MKYYLGVALVLFALVIIGSTFLPLLQAELGYHLREIEPQDQKDTLEPLDKDFGIVIPKIGANAHVIKNVNPYDARIYQSALSRGVAHAQGTALPGQKGNIFLFSHSSSDFLNAIRYNSIFYLLTKLEKGDLIKIYFEGKEYDYIVKGKQIVESNAIKYLTDKTTEENLTLMTCWPPGTSLKRLIVLASKNNPL